VSDQRLRVWASGLPAGDDRGTTGWPIKVSVEVPRDLVEGVEGHVVGSVAGLLDMLGTVVSGNTGVEVRWEVEDE